MTELQALPQRRFLSIRALLLTAATLLTVLALPVGTASAHTDFEESSPADGATIAEPVGVVTLQFSGDTEHGDDAFTVLTPDGHVRTPTTVSSSDQRVFDLTFDPPLAGGEIGLRWSVNAPDLHTISGTFSFTVTAPATGGSGTMVMADDSTMDMDTDEDHSGAMVMADGSTMDMSGADTSLDEFLSESASRPGEGTARWGRLLGFTALALLIGGAAFAATTLRGRRSEIDRAVAILRILGVALAAGGLVEYVGVTRIAEASIVGFWSSQPGFATLMRVAGGLAVAAGLAAVTIPVRAPQPAHALSAGVNSAMEYEQEELARFWPDDRGKRSTPGHNEVDTAQPIEFSRAIDPLLLRHQHGGSLVPGPRRERNSVTISTSPPPRPPRPVETPDAPKRSVSQPRDAESPVIRQWVLDRSSTVGYIGVAIAIMSFWFDGHTVSKGFWPLHAILNSVHVVAGSIWLGGVVAMAVVLWSRHRSTVAPRALEMIVRFSGIAAVALGAVVVAGGVMAFLVLDSVDELFSTPWGQTLLLKSAAAGLAMAGGAYNHFRLLPALQAHPDDPRLVERLRTAVTAEAILLGFVIVVTASLVVAAS